MTAARKPARTPAAHIRRERKRGATDLTDVKKQTVYALLVLLEHINSRRAERCCSIQRLCSLYSITLTIGLHSVDKIALTGLKAHVFMILSAAVFDEMAV